MSYTEGRSTLVHPNDRLPTLWLLIKLLVPTTDDCFSVHKFMIVLSIHDCFYQSLICSLISKLQMTSVLEPLLSGHADT